MSKYLHKEKVLFFCQNDEGDISMESKENIDTLLQTLEEHDQDVDFEVIAKVPFYRITMDMGPEDVEWYKPDISSEIKNKAIMSALKYLLNK